MLRGARTCQHARHNILAWLPITSQPVYLTILSRNMPQLIILSQVNKSVSSLPKPIPSMSAGSARPSQVVSTGYVFIFLSFHTFDKTDSTSSTEGYRLKLDNKFQYGQKNKDGELRFVVYHDIKLKSYQVSDFFNALWFPFFFPLFFNIFSLVIIFIQVMKEAQKYLTSSPSTASLHRNSTWIRWSRQSTGIGDQVWVWRHRWSGWNFR